MYTLAEHQRFVDALLSHLGVTDNVVFVIHDWGSSLGFDWAYRHPEAVKGIAYMEAILYHYTWEDWPEAARAIFQGFRSPAGEEMILEKNLFVEAVLPGSVMRKMTDAEMEVYHRPFVNPGEDRRPTLTWPREIAIEGKPKQVVELVERYGRWLSQSNVPKLFINAEPGAILTGNAREFCRSFPNQDEITVKGIHFVQEDAPDEIGEAVASFVRRLST